ncbi:NfeD family protein [Paenibacillus larvae]|uniref:NfeD family protein n=1 Tax=Paenibacillus larvae TaxID=1464 RepID=UPI0028538E7B|nr:NfeD family protein [Paenibacillus larvae]MDR5601025.1 NfeD family protein [Paenibacillus larvae]
MDWCIIWLVIGIILIVAEMATLTFYLLWLGIGSLAASLAALIVPGHVLIQILVWGVVVGVLTFFTKPLTRKFRHSEVYKDAIEEIIGKKGEVMQKIEVGKMGIVRVGNEMWSAIADEQIGIGETVMVVQRKNTIIEVTKWRGV